MYGNSQKGVYEPIANKNAKTRILATSIATLLLKDVFILLPLKTIFKTFEIQDTYLEISKTGTYNRQLSVDHADTNLQKRYFYFWQKDIA